MGQYGRPNLALAGILVNFKVLLFNVVFLPWIVIDGGSR